jgi:hypothetical protein
MRLIRHTACPRIFPVKFFPAAGSFADWFGDTGDGWVSQALFHCWLPSLSA